MITSIKADNISAYKALFEEASDILSGYKRVRTYDSDVQEYFYKDAEATSSENLYVKLEIADLVDFAKKLEQFSILYVKDGEPAEGFEPMYGITTLEEYFSWISNLGRINRKYTILPLDEDHFEINANTRAINIPANFKKNGVAVQGDDLAEILYFKIDRYFDYMDLNNCDIYIQWETPKDANGVTKKSVSQAYVRDIDSEPGKLIFGWAISDAITGLSGNLKFSVRFFEWENPEEVETGGAKTLAYSFSTLTAQVPIQPSINLDIETAEELEVDDVGNRLIERLENSVIAGGYAAAFPVFEKDLDDPNADLIYDLETLDNIEFFYELLVHAYATDTGAVSYVWKKQELNEDNEVTGEEITSTIVENRMVEIDDVANATIEKYPYTLYQLNGTDVNGKPIYTVYRKTLPPSAEDLDQGLRLFEKHSAFTADSTGVYWAVAENRITNSSASTLSKKAMFPRPSYIKIEEQPLKKGILRDVDGDDPDLGAVCEIGVKVEEKAHEVKTYQWFMDDNHVLNFGDVTPAWEKIDGATDATYIASAPGHYKVEVTNTRNNATKVLESELSRVTYPAAVPAFEGDGMNAKIFQVNSLSPENCPTITLDDTVESDGYSVQWFLYEDTKGTPVTEEIELGYDPVAKKVVTVASFNPLDYQDVITNISADKDIDGAYYAIVTNHVNGSTATTVAPDYEDMFKITY